MVDVNPREHGHFGPLMEQRIVGPDCLLQNPPDLVVMMNPEYELEVRSTIENIGIGCEVVSTWGQLCGLRIVGHVVVMTYISSSISGFNP